MIKIEIDNTVMNFIEQQHLTYYLSEKKVKKRLEDMKSEYLKKKIFTSILRVSKDRIEFIEYLISNIDDVLIGKPFFLREVIEKSNSLKIRLRKPLNTPTIFYKKLEEIFKYTDGFDLGPKSNSLKSSRKWTSYHLTDKLNVNVCPYCNRIYTSTYYSKEEGRSRPHLDHYYSKSKFPFLGVSLYNLIPSCYSCNSSFKGDINFFNKKYFHPYENSLGMKMKFTLKPIKNEFNSKNIKRNGYDLEFIDGNLESYNIEMDDSLETNSEIKERWGNSNQVFHINEMYQTHKVELNRLIQFSKTYVPEYTTWLEKKYLGKVFKSKDEINQVSLRNYTNQSDFMKQPLAKLTFDIGKELKLF